MTAPEWTAVAVCVVLLVITALCGNHISKRRRKEGRR